MIRLEQPDGEAVYYAKTTDSEYLKKFQISIPTDTNMQAYVRILETCDSVERSLASLSMYLYRSNVEW